MERIALIGAGRMGTGIAGCLLRAGHALRYLDHPGNADTAALDDAGAERVAGLEALMADRTALVVVVTGAPEVEAAVDGALPHLAGAAVIDCSTSLPETSRRLAARVAGAGGAWLDAAMTRTPKEAAEGRLGLLVGAEAAAFARWRPVLAAFAESIVRAGGPGEGHAAKLIHNFVSLSFSAVLAEAARAADAAGIPRATLVELLAAGGGRSAILERFAPWLTEGDDGAFAFTLANAAKDTGYFADAAPGPLAAAVREVYAQAAARDPDAPVPSLVPPLD